MSNTDWPWRASHLLANVYQVDLSPVGRMAHTCQNHSSPTSAERKKGGGGESGAMPPKEAKAHSTVKP